MGTISKAIIDWLKEYEQLKIETTHISDGSDKYGLYKSPSRNITEYNDGSYEITENYQFFARQSADSEYDRKDSDEWLEELSYWADDYRFNYEYPALTGNRKITNISLTGMPYAFEATGEDILYQMSLAITYLREREDNI